MKNPLAQIPSSLKDGTLWLKYFTLMAIPVGLVMTIKNLVFAPRGWIIFSLLTIAASVYALRETRYFRQWSISTEMTRLIAIFAVIGCLFNYIFLTVLVLIAIPFVKKYTDQLGYDEPPKLGDPYDKVLFQFRRITGDPVLPTTKQLTSTAAADTATEAPAAPAAKAAPVKVETFRGKSWLAAYINTLPFPDDFAEGTPIYKIMLPKPSQWQPERALQLMEHLLSALGGRVTFQLAAEHDKIEWSIIDIGKQQPPELIIQAVRAVFSEAEVIPTPYQPPRPEKAFVRYTNLLLQQRDFEFPLNSVTDFPKGDPLATIVNHFSILPPGVRITQTLHVKGEIPLQARKQAQKRITKGVLPSFSSSPTSVVGAAGLVGEIVGEGMGRAIFGSPRRDKYEGGVQGVLQRRLNTEPLLRAYCVQQLEIFHEAADSDLDLGAVLGGFAGWNALTSDFNALRDYPKDFNDDEMIEVYTDHLEQKTSVIGLITMWEKLNKNDIAMTLSPGELAAFWHLPHTEMTAPEVQWLEGAKAPAEIARNKAGVLIGDNEYAGIKTPIYLDDKDRTTGMYVLGKPGMGKSTFLHSLIHQDIQRGFGVAVIDPHGKLVNDILGWSIPESRENDLVVIDLNYDAVPAPLNPLIIPNQTGSIAAGRVLAAMTTVYDLSRAERALNALKAALTTLAVEPTPTLRDIIRLYNDPAYRDSIKKQAQGTVNDRLTWEFWQDYEALPSTNAQQELVYPIVHRLRALYGNDFLYPMLCNPNTIDVAEMIAQKKIVLVSLDTDRDKVPDDERRLIGAILVSAFQMAGMKSFREGAPNFYLYVDEVQNFVTTSISVALTEARKYGLSLHMANQYLDQLKGDTLKAVLGAIGSMVVFQVGHDDARELAPYFQPQFSANDFVSMERYKAAMKASAAGLPAFSLLTREPAGRPKTPEEKEAARERADRLRQLAYDNSGWKTRQEVMGWLDNRYPLPWQKSQQVGGAGTGDDWTVQPDTTP